MEKKKLIYVGLGAVGLFILFKLINKEESESNFNGKPTNFLGGVKSFFGGSGTSTLGSTTTSTITSTSTSINALMRMIIVVTCGLGSLTTYARTAVMPSRGKVLQIRRLM